MDSQSLKMNLKGENTEHNEEKYEWPTLNKFSLFSVPVHTFFIFISHHEQIISQLSFCCHVYRE